MLTDSSLFLLWKRNKDNRANNMIKRSNKEQSKLNKTKSIQVQRIDQKSIEQNKS